MILYPPSNSVAISILGLNIKWYGIIMSISIIIGLCFSYLLISKKMSKQSAELFLDFSPSTVIFAIIGARLFYVIGNYEYYFKHPFEILCINHGGLSIFGAILFGLLYCPCVQ